MRAGQTGRWWSTCAGDHTVPPVHFHSRCSLCYMVTQPRYQTKAGLAVPAADGMSHRQHPVAPCSPTRVSSRYFQCIPRNGTCCDRPYCVRVRDDCWQLAENSDGAKEKRLEQVCSAAPRSDHSKVTGTCGRCWTRVTVNSLPRRCHLRACRLPANCTCGNKVYTRCAHRACMRRNSMPLYMLVAKSMVLEGVRVHKKNVAHPCMTNIFHSSFNRL